MALPEKGESPDTKEGLRYTLKGLPEKVDSDQHFI